MKNEQTPSSQSFSASCYASCGFWGRLKMAYRLKELTGISLWKRPSGIDPMEALEAIATALFVLTFPLWFLGKWALRPIQPIWIALTYPASRLQSAVLKWEEVSEHNASLSHGDESAR